MGPPPLLPLTRMRQQTACRAGLLAPGIDALCTTGARRRQLQPRLSGAPAALQTRPSPRMRSSIPRSPRGALTFTQHACWARVGDTEHCVCVMRNYGNRLSMAGR